MSTPAIASASQGRHVFDVSLRPTLGSTFQPTGFPDLGAATFERTVRAGDHVRKQPCLLVESVQSMANRLEETTWDASTQLPVAAVGGLPYIEIVNASGTFLSSSRLEAHRIFSAYVRDSTWDGNPGDQVLLDKLGILPETPLDYRRMAQAILAVDPLSLLHGVFFAGKTGRDGKRAAWPAQPRFTRAVSAVIEAHDVTEVASGGRKSELVRHSLGDDVASTGGTAEGYGSIPFHRTEFTAADITASFVVDLDLLRSYGLPAPATDLLETLALWEIRSLLNGGLRLRTACDLELVDDTTITDRRTHTPLPDLPDLTEQLTTHITAAAAYLGDGKAITVQWTPKPGKAKSNKAD
ncbi:type I-U CRISPR-associated protein Cas7 [Kineosporia sp. J2-2]|uniref:Type I-U CRISPR-associated protein Cas7 n=1 Tax=Kineosporia corallincola TaxID=2835133 RepID=A0ABS5TTU2_9ACTN|nr:type I-U CRISPR-associated RAMP protein Csb1/Cas7u [Kineosporia corallincola]MBT0774223.1 type I-U CRISPR-associated protein Cas7 [Kineosporia corallincola]